MIRNKWALVVQRLLVELVLRVKLWDFRMRLPRLLCLPRLLGLFLRQRDSAAAAALL
jgi:hypothetical protein